MKDSVESVLVRGSLLFFTGSLLILFSCTGSPEGNSSDGKLWFAMQNCDACHGNNGSGGQAPVIHKTELSYRQLLAKVRNPKSVIMPTFSEEVLSNKKVADIFFYLQDEKKSSK